MDIFVNISLVYIACVNLKIVWFILLTYYLITKTICLRVNLSFGLSKGYNINISFSSQNSICSWRIG
ncbi:MAG: hypothetical protein CVU41_18055 [Chloroflexi bacterium HGW-Chloroflexi-3]|nr:MAG: hypothetical protein CVU41_18055 [Chloroflexi bacterium HGW-Chloroflexi-3]